jgi:dihydrofolate reductase
MRKEMADTEVGGVQDRTEGVPVRKVVVSEFVSVDGVMEDPGWTFQFGSEEQEKYKFAELAASDALLLGRVTYEGFAAAWPNMMNQYEGPRRAELQEYTDMMNGYPKYVVSTTLEEPLEWNNSTLIRSNVAEEIARLKRQPGQDITILGSGALLRWLLRGDLVDELRLMVHPVVLGGGKRLFEDGRQALELVDSKAFGTGVLYLTYQPPQS